MPADAGFFVVCDLRRFLTAPTFEAEHALWRRILDDANVNITPGAACRIVEPGFFRLCYAAVPGEAFGPSGYLRLSYALGDDALLEGVQRLQQLFSA